MSQRFEDSDERLTDEEVQAIIKRYGERQPGADPRPTVSDVAEALQIDPGVVSRLLREVRAADSERELRERLARLEHENEALRRRAEESVDDDFYPAMHWSRRRWRSRRPRVIFASLAAALIAVGLTSSRSGETPFPFWTLFLIAAAAFVILRVVRRIS